MGKKSATGNLEECPKRVFIPAVRFVCLISALLVLAPGSAGRAQPESPGELMQAAIESYAAGERHWAYQEVKREYDRKGRLKEETISRVDPSLPWDQRDVLISTEKGPATEKQKRRYQKSREKERRAVERGAQRERRLRDLIDFAAVTLQSSADGISTLSLPVVPDPDTDFPVERITMMARIDEATRDLAEISARLDESVRYKAVANIKGMNLNLHFSPVSEEDRPPALVQLSGTARATVLLFPVGGSIEIQRTHHRWVTPYDDRFNVEVGTPTAIDF